jgi:hypothetical protein
MSISQSSRKPVEYTLFCNPGVSDLQRAGYSRNLREPCRAHLFLSTTNSEAKMFQAKILSMIGAKHDS